MNISNAITIRQAIAADVPLILTFIRALADYEKLLDRVSATETKLHATLFGERPAAETLLAYLGDQPVGFALFFQNYSTFLAQPGIYLEDLYVNPDARGHGIGLALIQAIAKLAHDRGCARMDWAVLDWNTPAIEFYRRIGAEPQTEWTTQRLMGEALARVAGAI
jgi:GNAT superfamily N-acetyltransferase